MRRALEGKGQGPGFISSRSRRNIPSLVCLRPAMDQLDRRIDGTMDQCTNWDQCTNGAMVGEKVESEWTMGKEQKIDGNGWLRLFSHTARPRARRIESLCAFTTHHFSNSVFANHVMCESKTEFGTSTNQYVPLRARDFSPKPGNVMDSAFKV